MPQTFTHTFDTAFFKGKVELPTGLFIDGQWVDGSEGKTIDVINPTTGKKIVDVAEGTSRDVDIAVKAAQKAFDTTWGLNAPGSVRAKFLSRLADIMEQHADELAAIESLDNGKTFKWARYIDTASTIEIIRYYSGWADKIQGKTVETNESKLVYTRHEPIGVVGQIIPWNFPLLMLAMKIAPALATGCTIVMKPSEITPLSALLMSKFIKEAGYPDGVFNLVNGYGSIVGQAIAEHHGIEKVAFTGSAAVGRKLMEAAAKTNLKEVSLELGGKSPNIIFEDADIDQAVEWAAFGIFWNQGQVCCAGSRIFVHANVYDEFLHKFTEKAKQLRVGDPFDPDSHEGPQISEAQIRRVLGYINSGKQDGAHVHYGGYRIGNEGYFISPTIFTNVSPDMKIVREEIFGPVGVLIKFEDDEDVIKQANDSVYGLAAAVFSRDITRALETAHKLKAGTAWVNCTNILSASAPFGGYKQSGIGRELGEYGLENYTAVKAVHVNLNQSMKY